MKSLTYITILAAFVFGFAPTEVNASNAEQENSAKAGKVNMNYSEANEVLVLEIFAPGSEERVRIIMRNAKGQFVHAEDALVNRRGVSFKIPMSGFENGSYSIEVIGANMQFKGDFEKL